MNILTAVFYVLLAGAIVSFAARHAVAWFRETRTGNDGLTDQERTVMAERYKATAGSKTVTSEERRALDLLREKRASH
jgi:hypothetical protein